MTGSVSGGSEAVVQSRMRIHVAAGDEVSVGEGGLQHGTHS
jgi:hypothetical protein